jgi:type IV pilus assembly protein PilC
MPTVFAYRARTPAGERVDGTMRAPDRTAALAKLRERMLIPSRLEPARPAFGPVRGLRRSKPGERLALFRAYAALEAAGVDFGTTMTLLQRQARSPRMREALASIRTDVERGGEKLWAAMSHRPDEFTDLEVAMVAAGEEAGNREEILDRLARFLERDERLRKKLGAALFYPGLVFAAAVCVSTYLLAAVVPQFARLFESLGIELSPALRVALAFDAAIANPSIDLGLACACALGIVAFARGLSTSEGALAADALRLRLPFVGEALGKATLARLCRVLATLLESGVNQVRALEVAVPVAESPIFSGAVEAARERLAGGLAASLDESLAPSASIPPLLLGFIRVGSTAGNLPDMLVRVAEYYEDDVESVLTALPAALQTAVTVGLGAVVSAIVYLVYVPLSTLSSSIR